MLTTLALTILSLGAYRVHASALPVQAADEDALVSRNINKVCGDGELGVGSTQTCTIVCPMCGEACQGTFAAIFNSDCSNHLSSSWGEETCATDYDKGYPVSCSGDSVTGITHDGERFGNCYKPNNSGFCGTSLGIATQYNNIYFCCKRL